MKPVVFEYKETCLVSQAEIQNESENFINRIEYLQDQLGNGYATPSGFINLPFDSSMQEQVELLVVEKKKLNPSVLVVCGIGGSNLGSRALVEACFGLFQTGVQPHVYWADTLDAQYLNSIIEAVEVELKEGKEVLLVTVTKSGTTTETVANFAIFLTILKKYKPDTYQDYTVVITDHASPLELYAQESNIAILPIPQQVGGRFSVFSAVGQFVLGMLNFNVTDLLEGARLAVQDATSLDLKKNSAAVSAFIQYHLYKKESIALHDIFVFSVQLESLGKWYRQLVGESLGKETNFNGEVVNIGITPTVSVGTIDLHSVGQLYLGGPRDKFFTFVGVDTLKANVIIPNVAQLDQLMPKMVGKDVSVIMHAIMQGVKTAYKKNNRPYVSFTLPALNAVSLGYFMQMAMIEVVYLANLFDINAFDQPHVELYKEEVRNYL